MKQTSGNITHELHGFQTNCASLYLALLLVMSGIIWVGGAVTGPSPTHGDKAIIPQQRSELFDNYNSRTQAGAGSFLSVPCHGLLT